MYSRQSVVYGILVNIVAVLGLSNSNASSPKDAPSVNSLTSLSTVICTVTLLVLDYTTLRYSFRKAILSSLALTNSSLGMLSTVL